jgi:tripeptidyl-peptidase-1
MGRGTPDVSALGEGFQVYVGGRVVSAGGTSASSPAFASMMSLLNEARLNAGKPAMGFLNPFLYKNADAFTDVVLGSNKIDRGGTPLPYGYNSSKGWDPVTGLGTPKFDKLLAAAMGGGPAPGPSPASRPREH